MNLLDKNRKKYKRKLEYFCSKEIPIRYSLFGSTEYQCTDLNRAFCSLDILDKWETNNYLLDRNYLYQDAIGNQVNRMVIKSNFDKIVHNAYPGNSVSSIQTISEYDLRKKIHMSRPLEPVTYRYASRHVLLADTGYGKTTVAKRIAYAYSSDEKQFKKQYHLDGSRFPVFLSCKDIEKIQISSCKDLYTVIYRLSSCLYNPLSIDFIGFKLMLNDALMSSSLLLIIDGLDEIHDPNDLERFTELLSVFLNENDQVHLLLTLNRTIFTSLEESHIKCTRILKEIPYIKFNLIPALEPEKIKEFIVQWNRSLKASQRKDKASLDLIDYQLGSPMLSYLRNFISVPLYLSETLVSVYESGQLIFPMSRYEVVSVFYAGLINGIAWKDSFQIDKEELKIMLSYVASYMSINQIEKLTEAEFVNQMMECSSSLCMMLKHKPEKQALYSLVRALENETQLFNKEVIPNPIETDTFYTLSLSFSKIQQLQEYLTAHAIVEGCSLPEVNVQWPSKVFESHYSDSKWITTAIFAALENYTVMSPLINKLVHLSETRSNIIADRIYRFLIEMILDDVSIPINIKHIIYKTIFKDGVTEYTVEALLDLMDIHYSDNFTDFIEQEYNRSIDVSDHKTVDYAIAYAMIRTDRYVRETSKNPCYIAEQLIQNSNSAGKYVLGLNMLIVQGWLAYSDAWKWWNSSSRALHIWLGAKGFTGFSDRFANRIRIALLNFEHSYYDLLVEAVEAIYLAGYTIDYRLVFTQKLYMHVIEALTANTTEKREDLEILLSLFTANPDSKNYHDEKSKSLGRQYLSLYLQSLTDLALISKMPVYFAVCAVSGCWETYELRWKAKDFSRIFQMHRHNADNKTKARFNHIERDLSEMVSSDV